MARQSLGEYVKELVVDIFKWAGVALVFGFLVCAVVDVVVGAVFGGAAGAFLLGPRHGFLGLGTIGLGEKTNLFHNERSPACQ